MRTGSGSGVSRNCKGKQDRWAMEESQDVRYTEWSPGRKATGEPYPMTNFSSVKESCGLEEDRVDKVRVPHIGRSGSDG